MKSNKQKLPIINLVILLILLVSAKLSISWSDRYFSIYFNQIPKLIIISCFGLILGFVFSGEYIYKLISNKTHKMKLIWGNLVICIIITLFIAIRLLGIISLVCINSISSSINEFFIYFLVLGVYLPKSLIKEGITE